MRVLLELALKYAVVLALTRDSPDQAVLEAFRKVARKTQAPKVPKAPKALNAPSRRRR